MGCLQSRKEEADIEHKRVSTEPILQLNWVECDESNTESAILDSNRRISVEEVRDSLLQAQLRCSQLNQQLNVLGLDDEDELELEPAPEVHRIEEGDKIEAIKQAES